MKAITKVSCKVMDKLTKGLYLPGHSRKIDTSEVFTAVSVEMVASTDLGPLFSVAHYSEQNGDLMRNPEMLFVRGVDERYYPAYWRNDFAGMEEESILFEGQTATRFKPHLQKAHADFANMWMRNIKEQQKL